MSRINPKPCKKICNNDEICNPISGRCVKRGGNAHNSFLKDADYKQWVREGKIGSHQQIETLPHQQRETRIQRLNEENERNQQTVNQLLQRQDEKKVKESSSEYIINPETNRRVKRNSALGKDILQLQTLRESKESPERNERLKMAESRSAERKKETRRKNTTKYN